MGALSGGKASQTHKVWPLVWMLIKSTVIEATSVFTSYSLWHPNKRSNNLMFLLLMKQAAPAPPGPLSPTSHSFISFISPLTFWPPCPFLPPGHLSQIFLHQSFHSYNPPIFSFTEPYDTISGNTIEKNIADKRLTEGRKWWGMEQRCGGSLCVSDVRTNIRTTQENKLEQPIKTREQKREKNKQLVVWFFFQTQSEHWCALRIYVASCSVSSLQLNEMEHLGAKTQFTTKFD